MSAHPLSSSIPSPAHHMQYPPSQQQQQQQPSQQQQQPYPPFFRNRTASTASTHSLSSSGRLSMSFDADGIPHFDSTPLSPSLRPSGSRNSLSSSPVVDFRHHSEPQHRPGSAPPHNYAGSTGSSGYAASTGSGHYAASGPAISHTTAAQTMDRVTAEKILRMTEEEQESVTLALIRRLEKLNAEKETISRTLEAENEGIVNRLLRSQSHSSGRGSSPISPMRTTAPSLPMPVTIPPPSHAHRGDGAATPPLTRSPTANLPVGAAPLTPRSSSYARFAQDHGNTAGARSISPNTARKGSYFPEQPVVVPSLRPSGGGMARAGSASDEDEDLGFLAKLTSLSSGAEQMMKRNRELSTFAKELWTLAKGYERVLGEMKEKHHIQPTVPLPPIPALPAFLTSEAPPQLQRPQASSPSTSSRPQMGGRTTSLTRERHGTITSPAPSPSPGGSLSGSTSASASGRTSASASTSISASHGSPSEPAPSSKGRIGRAPTSSTSPTGSTSGFAPLTPTSTTVLSTSQPRVGFVASKSPVKAEAPANGGGRGATRREANGSNGSSDEGRKGALTASNSEEGFASSRGARESTPRPANLGGVVRSESGREVGTPTTSGTMGGSGGNGTGNVASPSGFGLLKGQLERAAAGRLAGGQGQARDREEGSGTPRAS